LAAGVRRARIAGVSVGTIVVDDTATRADQPRPCVGVGQNGGIASIASSAAVPPVCEEEVAVRGEAAVAAPPPDNCHDQVGGMAKVPADSYGPAIAAFGPRPNRVHRGHASPATPTRAGHQLLRRRHNHGSRQVDAPTSATRRAIHPVQARACDDLAGDHDPRGRDDRDVNAVQANGGRCGDERAVDHDIALTDEDEILADLDALASTDVEVVNDFGRHQAREFCLRRSAWRSDLRQRGSSAECAQAHRQKQGRHDRANRPGTQK
jgi:hypothetical protein